MDTTQLDSLEKSLLSAIQSAKPSIAQLEGHKALIQLALKNNMSKRFIWKWMKKEGLFNYNYATFCKAFSKVIQ